MRAKKWMILLFYLLLLFEFIYMGYSKLMNNNNSWVFWGLLSIAAIYQIIRFLIKKKDESWNSGYVIADHRIIRQILVSLALSFVFILVFLVIGTVGLYTGFIVGNPINVMVAAIIFSVLVFMVSQIVQQFIN